MALVDIAWAGRTLAIELQWLGAEQADRPLMLFLHEGLGSVSMWRDYPAQLCAALGCRGLVYSRPGYGRSSQRPADEALNPDYLHRQAWEVLPALLQALNIDSAAQPVWLLGHSDGASIALLYAARYPERVAGAVLLAPHVVVEDLSITSINQARSAYLETDLPQRLARHHDHPDAVFWSWNDIWLHPGFRDWSIEPAISTITCPILAIQGQDDEYGTLEQVHGIARRLPQTQVVVLNGCKHSPQRDQPLALTAAVARFFDHQTGDKP